MQIDTKAIRFKLMSERKVANLKISPSNDPYYDGVMDALMEVEKMSALEVVRV